MTNSQRLATVRVRLLRWLADQQVGGDLSVENPILSESILIRNEFYCGRRFHTSTHQAVWFIEEDELKIYKENGELACVFSGNEIELDLLSKNPQAKPDSPEPESAPDVIKLPAPTGRAGDCDGETRRAA